MEIISCINSSIHCWILFILTLNRLWTSVPCFDNKSMYSRHVRRYSLNTTYYYYYYNKVILGANLNCSWYLTFATLIIYIIGVMKEFQWWSGAIEFCITKAHCTIPTLGFVCQFQWIFIIVTVKVSWNTSSDWKGPGNFFFFWLREPTSKNNNNYKGPHLQPGVLQGCLSWQKRKKEKKPRDAA